MVHGSYSGQPSLCHLLPRSAAVMRSKHCTAFAGPLSATPPAYRRNAGQRTTSSRDTRREDDHGDASRPSCGRMPFGGAALVRRAAVRRSGFRSARGPARKLVRKPGGKRIRRWDHRRGASAAVSGPIVDEALGSARCPRGRVRHFAGRSYRDDRRQTGIRCGDTSAALTGSTMGGQTIEGSDVIRTVGCR
jgi:hypothetical protein